MTAKKRASSVKKKTVNTAATAKPATTEKKVTAAETRATLAEAKLKRLESKVEKLKALDKVGVGRRVSGFVEFLREQSVVGLAIGLVLGSQAKALVDQLIISFINPLVGLLMPGKGTLQDQMFVVIKNGEKIQFRWGAFVLSVLTFLIVAAVVYFAFKGLKLDKLDKKKED